MSTQVQYILVFIILAAIIGWLVYSLLRKRPDRPSHCCGCSLADSCKKKTERRDCGGNGDAHKNK